MSLDQMVPPIGAGLFLTAAAYAAFAMFVSGPVIGQRSIERSGWSALCESSVVQAATEDAPELETPISTPDCNSIMGIFAGADSRQLCTVMEPLFQNPLAGQIERQNQSLIDAHQRRVESVAAQAASSCSCAMNVQLEERLPWALYAGSARLITPPEIQNLEAELFAALNSPVCSGRF